MHLWRPITDDEFSQLFVDQYGELTSEERDLFDQYRVSPWKAVIRRTEDAGDEQVFVVAQVNDGGLYFDDVEYGFNISCIDKTGRIMTPGGSQNSLKDAVNQWFPRELNQTRI